MQRVRDEMSDLQTGAAHRISECESELARDPRTHAQLTAPHAAHHPPPTLKLSPGIVSHVLALGAAARGVCRAVRRRHAQHGQGVALPR